MNKYFMTAEEEDRLEILIYGDITSWEWEESDVSSYTLARQIQASKAKNFLVKINSYGGEVAEALAIYNELRNKSKEGAKVVTMDMGFACSAAAVIFMAGDCRIMMSASLLMIHNAWTYASGNAEALRKKADDLEKMSETAAETFRRVMKISEEELTKLLEEESWIKPADALAYGFASEVMPEENKQGIQSFVKEKIYGRLVSRPDPEETGFAKLFGKFNHQ